MARITCYRCFWPKTLCWCESITPMETRTRFVFLMHPKEFKQEKAATGRLTHLCLAHSQIVCGIGFEENETVQSLIADPANLPVLLYPGREALNLSLAADPDASARLSALRDELTRRVLTVFLLDATWALGRKMLRLSPSLQRLPRIMFTPESPSRYVIKQQPHPSCLSTLEAVHELLRVLERQGLDRYPLPDQLLGIFQRMQDYQLRCAADPARAGYRHRPYRPPAERRPAQGESARRRRSLFKLPA
ncbi:MAG: DTW domain-containing protein [Verrucomicrobia bacterium]|nr:DTW domain-containing protein [Verrucomicrobiota bacterium]